MADGTEKPIADVKVGEYVLSFPDTAPTDGFQASKVTRLIVHHNSTSYERLALSDGKVLNVTDYHYLLTALGPTGSKKLFTNVSELEPGDTVYAYDRATDWYDPVTIVSKTRVESEAPVYSLEVQSTHTFLADDIAAHNTRMSRITGMGTNTCLEPCYTTG